MKTLKLAWMLAVLVGLMGCKTEIPVSETHTKWFKGNLHTHSYWSDGDEFPEVILDWYKARGYQFAALSDHNVLAQGEKWKVLSPDSIYQQAFREYLGKYGDEWVVHKVDSGRTSVRLKTFAEYRERTEVPGSFLVVPSEEISDSYEGKPIHMNATNVQGVIEPQGGGSVAEVIQNNLDQVIRQRRETGTPVMQHLNHPNFYYAVTMEDMMALNGERFFEVYNGHPAVHNMGDSVHIDTETMWDLINISYITHQKPLLYGLATDDSHHYHQKGSRWSNAGRGWVMVQADTLTAPALIEAMEAGNFYASTGVTLDTLSRKGQTLSMAVRPEEGVSYTFSFIGCKKGEDETRVLQETKGTAASFEMPDDLLFVRCKILSSKMQENPIEELLYETAWTQPVTAP